MTTKEKTVIGIVGAIATGLVAYTLYDYDKVIKENNKLKDYINDNLYGSGGSSSGRKISSSRTISNKPVMRPKIINTVIKNGLKTTYFDNDMQLIEWISKEA